MINSSLIGQRSGHLLFSLQMPEVILTHITAALPTRSIISEGLSRPSSSCSGACLGASPSHGCREGSQRMHAPLELQTTEEFPALSGLQRSIWSSGPSVWVLGLIVKTTSIYTCVITRRHTGTTSLNVRVSLQFNIPYPICIGLELESCCFCVFKYC